MQYNLSNGHLWRFSITSAFCLCLSFSSLVSPPPLSSTFTGYKRSLLTQQSTKALSRCSNYITTCGYHSGNAMEGHFFVRNGPNIKPLLMWSGSFQVPMANSVLRMRTKSEQISYKTPCLWTVDWNAILLWEWAKREASWISQNPKCLVAVVQSHWLCTYHPKIYQILKHSSNMSLPLWSLLPSSNPQRSVSPFLLSVSIFITFPTKNRHNKSSGHIG